MALPIGTAAPRPCKECPFLKNSIPGWLGPWPDSGTLHLHIVNEQDFACHMTTGDDEEEEFPEGAKRCTGSIMYASKSCKRFNDPVLKKEQQRLTPTDEVMDLFEFREHHQKKTSLK
jgi:hypothetical protein